MIETEWLNYRGHEVIILKDREEQFACDILSHSKDDVIYGYGGFKSASEAKHHAVVHIDHRYGV